MNNAKLIIFFILCFFGTHFYAQAQQLPVTEIIDALEKKFPYTFSYADEVVKNQHSPIPPPQLSFEEALHFIEKETGLKFSILSGKVVVVQKPTTNAPSPKIQQLQEVILSNYLARGISKKTGGVFEIGYQHFGILPGLIEPDVLLSLQALPGVESINETTSEINIRGGTHDQNLILWDDIRVYQSGHFFGLISAFNPYQTKKAKLVKNGTDAAYGQSVSSVVSMETEKEINNELYAETGTNFISAHAFVDVPVSSRSSLQFSARTSINNIVETPTYKQYYNRAFQDTEVTANVGEVTNNNEGFWFYDTNFRYLLELSEKDKLRFNFFNITNKLDFTENLQSEISRSNQSSLAQNSIGGGAFYQRDWNTNFITTAQFYISNYHLESNNADIPNDQRLIQENEILETSLKVSGFLRLNEKYNLKSGYQFLETGISNTEDINNPVFRRYIKEVIVNHALFGSIQYKSADLLTTVEAGARANYFEKFNIWLLEPRLSFNQRFLDFFTLEILAEHKSQATTQVIDFQTDFLGIEKRRWQLADQEDIPILKSKQFSVGLHYNRNNWLISGETYIKKVSGITSQSQGFQNQYEHAQFTGSYLVKGLDFLINKKFDKFSSWISYSLTNNTYTFPTLEAETFPNNAEIVNSLSFAASYEIKNFKIATGLHWRNGKPFTPISPEGISSNFFDFEKANSSNLPNYWRLDISASQDFQFYKTLDASIGASIWNVLDNKNIINSYYRQNNGEIELVQQQALGVTPNLLLRVFF